MSRKIYEQQDIDKENNKSDDSDRRERKKSITNNVFYGIF